MSTEPLPVESTPGPLKRASKFAVWFALGGLSPQRPPLLLNYIIRPFLLIFLPLGHENRGTRAGIRDSESHKDKFCL